MISNFIKSYNTSSMYNLMYEDTSLSSFTMLRHWIESGKFLESLNKYLQEFNYDAQDPTGLALGEHFGHADAYKTYSCSTDMAEAITAQSTQHWFGEFFSIASPRQELVGELDQRLLPINYRYSYDFEDVDDHQFLSILDPRSMELDPSATTISETIEKSTLRSGNGNSFTTGWDPRRWSFRPRFHYELKWTTKIHRKREKYIDIPGGTPNNGNLRDWKSYLHARTYGGMTNMAALRAGYRSTVAKLGGGACASYACAFILNYQSLMAGNGITITPDERVRHHNANNHGHYHASDLSFLFDMDHTYGNAVSAQSNSDYAIDLPSSPSTYSLGDIYGAMAQSITRNSPVMFSGTRYYNGIGFGGHSEITIGHRYTETETTEHHIVIDSETGFSHKKSVSYTISAYTPIQIRNLNNNIAFNWRLVFDNKLYATSTDPGFYHWS